MSLSLSHCIAVIFSHTRCQHPRVGGSQAFGVGLTMWTILWTAWRHSEQLLKQPWDQSCQPPIFSPDICAKSESNPKCLRKSLHQMNPKRRVFATKPVLRQKRGLVELQLGHVIIGMIPATPSMHENHAFDHKKIVNIVWKAHLFCHARRNCQIAAWTCNNWQQHLCIKSMQLTIKILLTEFEKLIYFATPDRKRDRNHGWMYKF